MGTLYLVVSQSIFNYSQIHWEVVLEVPKDEMAHMVVNEVYLVDFIVDQHFYKARDALGLAHWARKATGIFPRQFSNTQWRCPTRKGHGKAYALLALSESDNEHESMPLMKAADKLKWSMICRDSKDWNNKTYCHVTISQVQICPSLAQNPLDRNCQYFNVWVVYKESLSMHSKISVGRLLCSIGTLLPGNRGICLQLPVERLPVLWQQN